MAPSFLMPIFYGGMNLTAENRFTENIVSYGLRLCKNISQAGNPVVLFGAGTGVPYNIEPCAERLVL